MVNLAKLAKWIPSPQATTSLKAPRPARMSDQQYHVIDASEGLAEGDESIKLRHRVEAVNSDDETDDDLPTAPFNRAAPKPRRSRPCTNTGQFLTFLDREAPERCCWCCCPISKTCLLITTLLFAALVVLISGGGVWMYKSAPKDGQSPPFYPTPTGGTVTSWQKSYAQAKALVEKMSLVEKVNITTGIG